MNSKRTLLRLGVMSITLFLLASLSASADVMSKIEKEGQLVVGVKSDYKPFGYVNPDGDLVGIEPDLARDVANALDVKLKLVPVASSNRMQFLNQGKIDLIIATMTDTAKRRKVVHFVSPDYYSAGVNIIARKKSGFEKWDDLGGAPVCGVQGAFYNKMAGKQYGANMISFKNITAVLKALQQGRCAAFIYDSNYLNILLNKDRWSNYEMALKTIHRKPWGIGVKKNETRMARFMSGMVVHWHITGELIRLQKKYDVEPIRFTTQMHEFFRNHFLPQ